MAKAKVRISEGPKKSPVEKQADQILELIEKTGDQLAWRKPWIGVDNAPESLWTGHRYTRGNAWALLIWGMLLGYDCPFWLTFEQVKQVNEKHGLSGHVNKGEHGFALLKPYTFKPKDKKTGEFIQKIDRRTGAKVFNEDGSPMYEVRTGFTQMVVFNAKHQCTGLDSLVDAKMKERKDKAGLVTPTDPVTKLEEIWLSAYHRLPAVSHGGNSAHYTPKDDAIQMPHFEQFSTALEYWNTRFHEVGHATGHPSRVGREMVSKMAEGQTTRDLPSNGREELVAEFTALNILSVAGFTDTMEQSAAYIQTWMKAFKDDKTLFYQAAKEASIAVEYILKDVAGFQQEEESDSE